MSYQSTAFLIIIEICHLHQPRQAYPLKWPSAWTQRPESWTEKTNRWEWEVHRPKSTDGSRTADWGNAVVYQPCEHSGHWWRDLGWINSWIRKINGDIETGFPRRHGKHWHPMERHGQCGHGSNTLERLVDHHANTWPDLIMVKSLQSKKLLSLYIKAYHFS